MTAWFEAESCGDYTIASTRFHDGFNIAASEGKLAEYAGMCRAQVLRPATRFCLPLAFAYEIRARLHDLSLWTFENGRWFPRGVMLDAIERSLNAPNAINCRDNYYLPIMLGINEFVRDRVHSAFRYFSIVSQYQDIYRVVRTDLGGGAVVAKAYPSREMLDEARGRRGFTRTPNFSLKFTKRKRLVISISFDLIYLKAFGFAWIDSLAALHLEDVGLHFNIIFRDSTVLDMMNALYLYASERGVDLAMSVEEGVRHTRAYYASARFMIAEALHREFGCPILFCDADSYIEEPDTFRDKYFSRMVSESRTLGFLARGPWNGYLPWRRFSATWLLSSPTAESGAFMRTVADAIEYFWDDRDRNWWIDQLALDVAKRTVDPTDTDGRFGDIHQELPNLLKTGEDYKVAKISALPEMQALLQAGKDYWAALAELQNG